MKKLPKSIRTVGLIANPEKSHCQESLDHAIQNVLASGRKVAADIVTAQMSSCPIQSYPDFSSLARHSDLLLVFGGDGTMLRVAREIAGLLTPILGIKAGGLGFLTAVTADRLMEALERVWKGHYHLESRPMIEAKGMIHNESFTQIALNDIVIARSAASRMIELEVTVDDEILTRYRCDGLIVSSPTGSTAYSLAAGGAIVCPAANVFAITPICPHTLSNRSVIVSLNSNVQVKVLSQKLETIMTADGQVPINLTAGGVVSIRRSRRRIHLIQLLGTSFFDTLRKKLSWSGSNL